ncbi:MAG TPA: S8 family serine peptidase [Ktedonobacteraceae bacterium]|nr:S8 family serine peptidase [Ktedonobacteraceae bacterium]
MERRLPAGSSQFTEQMIRTIPLIYPIDAITWKQACGNNRGKGVKVAIIDSGIDATHPALNGPINGYVEIVASPDGVYYETAPHDDSCGHGTACAGIVRSLAPECEIYSVKVLGKGLIGRGATFIAGLRWAVENNMQVCNLSLGTTKKEFFATLHEIADLAYFRRIILVAAANNLPVPSFPSMYASVISVAAHHEQEPRRFYYNQEPPVEFGAPGIDVHVPWLHQKWITATGNSFAAPHITGIVTKILGNNPELTPFHIKTILRALAANSSYSPE